LVAVVAGIDRDMGGSSRVLVLIQGAADDLPAGSLGDRRTGPEIRGWEIVRALAERHDVTAAASVGEPTTLDGVRVVPRSRRSILKELNRHDSIVGPAIPPYALVAGRNCLRVADLYDPVELELATVGGWRGRRDGARRRANRQLQLRWADVLLCANGRQRDAIDRDLTGVERPSPPRILTIPMGLPAAPTASVGHPLRDRFEQIGPADPLVLWWGSVWRWLDAKTVVEAIEILALRRPDLRLVITAGRPADSNTDPLNVTDEVRDVARDRGLLGRHVFFLDEWVPFEARHHYLADADIGITLHADTPEAAMAARARYMDCVWASLPLVLAEGDETADRLAGAGAATLVPPHDPPAAAAAIDALLSDSGRLEAAGAACRRVSEEFQWSTLLAPLVDCVGRIPKSRGSRGELLSAVGQAGRYYLGRSLDRTVDQMAQQLRRARSRPA
jgi:glycosyltransferase involved in cell wall biosynthesis